MIHLFFNFESLKLYKPFIIDIILWWHCYFVYVGILYSDMKWNNCEIRRKGSNIKFSFWKMHIHYIVVWNTDDAAPEVESWIPIEYLSIQSDIRRLLLGSSCYEYQLLYCLMTSGMSLCMQIRTNDDSHRWMPARNAG